MFGVVLHERSVSKQLAALGFRQLSGAPAAPEVEPGDAGGVQKNFPEAESTTVVVGIERVLHRRRRRSVEVLACLVTWRPHPEQTASARRGYEHWWQALDWALDGLLAGGMQREVEQTVAMPKVRPWT